MTVSKHPDALLDERIARLFGEDGPDDRHSLMGLDYCDGEGCTVELREEEVPLGLCAKCRGKD